MTEHATFPRPGWGHSTGALSLPPMAPLNESQVIDHDEIVECLYRYAWSFDERQTGMLERCFAEDVIWEASIMGEMTIGPYRGRPSVMGFMTGFWPAQADQRRHMITNAVVTDLGDDRATLYSYHLLVSTTSTGVRPVTTGWYRILMTRERGRWCFLSLLAGYDVPF